MAYLQGLEDVVLQLRGRLRDYLSLKAPYRPEGNKKFRCFVHEDTSPSMCLNPKTNEETVHCFACGVTLDIFSAAAHLEGLAASGPDWVKETIPHLCGLLGIEVKMGEPTLQDAEKAKKLKLARDIADILIQAGDPTGYAAKRAWEQEAINYGSISEDLLVSRLVERGWDALDVARSLLVRTNSQHYFGENKLTFVIKDERGRPIGFIYRDLSGADAKYVNTPESMIYSKSKTLLGLDTAIQAARKDGLYIVEGPGDVAQLKRTGVMNSVATCGTALTVDHLLLIKALGIRKVYLSMDWDGPGEDATNRVFFDVAKQVQGISLFVVGKPAGGEKDPDELLKAETTPELYTTLPTLPAFEWVVARLSDNETPDSICDKMVPLIAAEPAAVRRELLMRKLAERTGISYVSIMSDVNFIRGGKAEERKERLLAAADQYRREVEEDPENIIAIMGQHEERVARIEKEYNRDVIGVGYQLQRYEAIQQSRQEGDGSNSGFRMGWFTEFARAMSGGTSWAEGAHFIVGGRANSGKTATCSALGTDVAMHDTDAMVIAHYTDDSYRQLEPRIKSTISRILNPKMDLLSVGMIDNPKVNMSNCPSEYWKLLQEADDAFRGLISNEHFVLVDAEDGSTMSTLEKQVRYYRQRYPSRKIMVLCDNTHNYMDYPQLEQTQRITMIANHQKLITNKYHSCLMATAEYRKNMPKDPKKMVLPVDDDLADARALMFRPNVIFHVYNDLHDRKEHAEIFHLDDESKMGPRLMLHFTKNKISSFKDKLMLDLDVKSVTLSQVDVEYAREESDRYLDAKEQGKVSLEAGEITWVDADWDPDEEELDDDGTENTAPW